MTRMLAFFAAILLSAVAVSSACTAGVSEATPLPHRCQRSSAKVYASFTRAAKSARHTGRPTSMPASCRSRCRSASSRRQDQPVRFALVRDAGRLDCAGTGGNRRHRAPAASRRTQASTDFLVAAASRRPTDERELWPWSRSNVRRDLVEALPMPRAIPCRQRR